MAAPVRRRHSPPNHFVVLRCVNLEVPSHLCERIGLCSIDGQDLVSGRRESHPPAPSQLSGSLSTRLALIVQPSGRTSRQEDMARAPSSGMATVSPFKSRTAWIRSLLKAADVGAGQDNDGIAGFDLHNAGGRRNAC